METTAFDKIIFVDNYAYAPKSAEYILRDTESEVLFEQYENGMNHCLLTFPVTGQTYKGSFNEILLVCRKMVGPDAIIYVEKPFWMVEPEFDDDNFVAENIGTIDEDEIEKYNEMKYFAGKYDDEDDEF